MATNASLQIPPTSSSRSPNRPVSVNVNSSAASPSSASSSRRQRASHQVVSPQQQSREQHSSRAQDDGNPPYTDVYNHPAAVAYASAHPRRTIPKFGPYLLLQTLGEGEFGKVKLGLHCQWGEEVAVKLIRRGNVDTAVRMSKVEREIEVLRTLKHPNIVRLYDVIETDKYIGIIIEYASGGELFDHILAHRYLRERDAAKLFSQLISGVWYIHQKKIVHRDLKLENLLLDRHRNVIITDFGFANRFEHRADDLMQTSCGSPCYAAPELVISEGLYVGSAVDIWSCGVILYAMLAGYLPFDDDPANPDGDNINLLYKYIVNTPLSFPDYISDSARDLLSIMLVPDPSRRATLDLVMKHPWLAAYDTPTSEEARRSGKATAFGKTVEDLENMAMEQHHQKRLAYQRQMKAAAAATSQNNINPNQSLPIVGRSQSQKDPYAAANGSLPAAVRSQSVEPTALYETSASKGSRDKVRYMSDDMNGDDPFAAPASLGVGSSSAAAEKKAHGRHTVQVEYDSRASKKDRADRDREREQRDREQRQQQEEEELRRQQREKEKERAERERERAEREKEKERAQREREQKERERESQRERERERVEPPLSPSKSERRRESESSHKPLPTTPGVISNGSTPHRERTQRSSQTSPKKHSVPPPVTTPQKSEPPSINVASPPDTPLQFVSPEGTDSEAVDGTRGTQRSGGSVGSAASKGHKKGMSVDRLMRIVTGSGSTEDTNASVSLNTPTAGAPSVASTTPAGSLLSPDKESGTESATDVSASAKKPRRATLQVMVGSLKGVASRSRKDRDFDGGKTPVSAVPPDSAVVEEERRGRSMKGANAIAVPGAQGEPMDPDMPSEDGINPPGANRAGLQASTNKALKVMQWFRNKSKARDSVGVVSSTEQQPMSAYPSDDYGSEREKHASQGVSSRKRNESSSTINQTGVIPEGYKTLPATHAQRAPSTATEASTSMHATVTPNSLINRFRDSFTVGGVGSGRSASRDRSSKTSVTKRATGSKNQGTVLRIHHGAVDPETTTTKPPVEVMKHIKEVLVGMGIDVQIESDYKLRCVRAKRKKTPNSSENVSSVGGGPYAAVTMVGSAASNGVDKRGLPVPPTHNSFSGSGSMLRLLMRRQSSQISTGPGSYEDDGMIAQSDSGDGHGPSSPTGREPLYGEWSEDVGDEVKFSVELTRLDRLEGTYSLDIRRMKGNLRSYKFLYDTIKRQVSRAELQR
uniref:non-specific serine/threonine protein kinase n=1 Tax=Moniliophthora roreri TaxID=221103 RepID=A0A0W0ETQ8_MONRR